MRHKWFLRKDMREGDLIPLSRFCCFGKILNSVGEGLEMYLSFRTQYHRLFVAVPIGDFGKKYGHTPRARRWTKRDEDMAVMP